MGQCQTVQYNKRESVPAALFRMCSARCVNLAGLSRRPECISLGLLTSAQDSNTLTIISKTPRIQSIVTVYYGPTEQLQPIRILYDLYKCLLWVQRPSSGLNTLRHFIEETLQIIFPILRC